uniref:Uncharacterized protein n=1 Tax=Caenorhabditis japonica TaxID=281687 RepID=A0A8R1J1S5_CAEJA
MLHAFLFIFLCTHIVIKKIKQKLWKFKIIIFKNQAPFSHHHHHRQCNFDFLPKVFHFSKRFIGAIRENIAQIGTFSSSAEYEEELSIERAREDEQREHINLSEIFGEHRNQPVALTETSLHSFEGVLNQNFELKPLPVPSSPSNSFHLSSEMSGNDSNPPNETAQKAQKARKKWKEHSLYRSEEMKLYQMILVKEAAFECVAEIGKRGNVQFVDHKDEEAKARLERSATTDDVELFSKSFGRGGMPKEDMPLTPLLQSDDNAW